MTESAVSPIAQAPARANAPAPSRPGALATPKIRLTLSLDPRQVLGVLINETTVTKLWVASPERLLSVELPTQTLRRALNTIRYLANGNADGFDGVVVTLQGRLGTANVISDPSISVLPKPSPVNGHRTVVGARRR